jgi:protein SERAC1
MPQPRRTGLRRCKRHLCSLPIKQILIASQALVTARQRSESHLKAILRDTRGIVFLGTPHSGSGLATWAERISRVLEIIKQPNTEITSVLRRDSEVLARIQDSFHAMVLSRSKEDLPPIEITCFYEELPMPKIGLVRYYRPHDRVLSTG